MPAKKLILKPDPIKVGLFNALFCGALGLALAALFGAVGVSVVISIVVGLVFAVGLLVVWGRPQATSWLELSRDHLTVVSDMNHKTLPWKDISRFTLLQFETDERDNTRQDSYYVTARTIGPADDADMATSLETADLTLKIDAYISYHRYSGRTPDQEAACKSPQDFADTLNRWRDFALNLEIGAIPTPHVISKEDAPNDFALALYSKLTG